MVGPCDLDCAGDPGCAQDPAAPGNVCSTCLQDAVSNLDACVTGPILDAAGPCQTDPDCDAYVDCVIQSGTNCEQTYPAGYALALAIVAQSCGDCGDGSP